MADRSNLTWRTFGLSVAGLCLACTHAAMAMAAAPTGARPAANASAAAAGVKPTEAPVRREGWVGVGATTIAGRPDETPSPDARRDGVAAIGRGRISMPGRSARVSSARSGGSPEPTQRADRARVLEQTRRVEASRQLAEAKPITPAAPEPSRTRDPRVERALARVASGPSLGRDAFGGGVANPFR